MIPTSGVVVRRKSRQHVPLPNTLAGRFFLVQYDRGTKTFRLIVDDEQHSSYNLGSDIPAIMRQFRLWGLPELGDSAVDIAKEFGAAQAILVDGRVIPVYEKPVSPTLTEMMTQKESEHDNGITGLRYL